MLSVSIYASGDVSASKLKSNYNVANFEGKKQCEKKEKKYKINVRKCRAASALMNDKYKKIFIMCLTVPESLKHTHKSINKSLNLFTNNLRTNYGLLSYIGTCEYQKNGSVHYHFLAAFNSEMLQFDKINNAWNNAINTIHYSNVDAANSVRFGGYNQKTKRRYYWITNTTHAIKYITKYLMKSRGEFHETKCYFISSDIRQVSITYHTKDYNFYTYLLSQRIGAVYVNEYVTLWQVCHDIALSLFNPNKHYYEKEKKRGNIFSDRLHSETFKEFKTRL